ncbi:MAG: T9SS type A sorting domain-containing protein [Bacteroidota bacterium]
MRFFIILFLFLFTGFVGISQEILTGLQINPMVKAKAMELSRMKAAAGDDLRAGDEYLKAASDTTPVSMPFFDDFSANGVFPSSQRWIDRFAFENDDLPVYPVNIGAMTLDAINDSGNMYPRAVPGPDFFIADFLTSRYIRLDSSFTPVPRALSPADSVYLSFFYQPQGRGKPPQKADSLILQFLAVPAHDSLITGGSIPVPDLWAKTWFANGMSLDTFYLNNNKWFVRVMIPVTDPRYFTNKFRFRFFNYVSLASSAEPSWQSNTDQWNLDDVYLNSGRTLNDTIYPELRFIYRPPSLLKRYESMPYPQYSDDPTNEMRDTIDILMSNRDIIPHMSSYNYYVTQPGGSFSKSYSGGNYNIQPYAVSPYVTFQKFAHPEVPFLIPINQTDSAIFLVKHIVKDITPGSVTGDTMQSYQKFLNYYAYDDGTPEASYGLTPAGSKLAYGFRLNKSPDTLRAVRMYFNKTLSNTSVQFFYLCVWNDNAGKPGDTIYSDLVMPRYADSMNKFVTYHIFPPLRITGTFYVGWIQTTNDNLSIGFDRYTNSQSQIFYNSTGVWNNSAYTGSLMIRPVVGKPIPLEVGDILPRNMKLTLFPNPCSESKINVRITDNLQNTGNSERATLIVSDIVGRVRMTTAFRNELDVTALQNGLYFLELRDQSGTRLGFAKFIISR